MERKIVKCCADLNCGGGLKEIDLVGRVTTSSMADARTPVAMCTLCGALYALRFVSEEAE